MSDITQNEAAWLVAPKIRPFKVGPGPDQTQPAADEVIVKVAYVAINPSEGGFQKHAYVPIEYPHVLGSDAAGTVVKVGSGVTKFKEGDRVFGYGLGLVYGGARHGTFQKYAAFREIVVAKIPDSLPFANAAVLPLSIATASTGLYEVLKLDYPTLTPKPNGKSVVIWGGSSSVGASTIQLAAAAGYTVVTTASPRNHALVKELGATHVFDQADPDVVNKIIGTVKGTLAGVYDIISIEDTVKACAEILSQCGGGVLPLTLFPPPKETLPSNVDALIVWATTPGTSRFDIAEAIWGNYIPKALEQGRFLAKPDPFIIKGGLEKIQDAVDLHGKGVSAQKIVVEL